MTDSANNQNFIKQSHNNVIEQVNKSLEDQAKDEEVSVTFTNRATAILIIIAFTMFLIFATAIIWHDLL